MAGVPDMRHGLVTVLRTINGTRLEAGRPAAGLVRELDDVRHVRRMNGVDPMTARLRFAAAALGLLIASPAAAQIQPADGVNTRPAQSMGYDGRGGTVVVIDPGGFDTTSQALKSR